MMTAGEYENERTVLLNVLLEVQQRMEDEQGELHDRIPLERERTLHRMPIVNATRHARGLHQEGTDAGCGLCRLDRDEQMASDELELARKAHMKAKAAMKRLDTKWEKQNRQVAARLLDRRKVRAGGGWAP